MNRRGERPPQQPDAPKGSLRAKEEELGQRLDFFNKKIQSNELLSYYREEKNKGNIPNKFDWGRGRTYTSDKDAAEAWVQETVQQLEETIKTINKDGYNDPEPDKKQETEKPKKEDPKKTPEKKTVRKEKNKRKDKTLDDEEGEDEEGDQDEVDVKDLDMDNLDQYLIVEDSPDDTDTKKKKVTKKEGEQKKDTDLDTSDKYVTVEEEEDEDEEEDEGQTFDLDEDLDQYLIIEDDQDVEDLDVDDLDQYLIVEEGQRKKKEKLPPGWSLDDAGEPLPPEPGDSTDTDRDEEDDIPPEFGSDTATEEDVNKRGVAKAKAEFQEKRSETLKFIEQLFDNKLVTPTLTWNGSSVSLQNNHLLKKGIFRKGNTLDEIGLHARIGGEYKRKKGSEKIHRFFFVSKSTDEKGFRGRFLYTTPEGAKGEILPSGETWSTDSLISAIEEWKARVIAYEEEQLHKPMQGDSGRAVEERPDTSDIDAGDDDPQIKPESTEVNQPKQETRDKDYEAVRQWILDTQPKQLSRNDIRQQFPMSSDRLTNIIRHLEADRLLKEPEGNKPRKVNITSFAYNATRGVIEGLQKLRKKRKKRILSLEEWNKKLSKAAEHRQETIKKINLLHEVESKPVEILKWGGKQRSLKTNTVYEYYTVDQARSITKAGSGRKIVVLGKKEDGTGLVAEDYETGKEFILDEKELIAIPKKEFSKRFREVTE